MFSSGYDSCRSRPVSHVIVLIVLAIVISNQRIAHACVLRYQKALPVGEYIADVTVVKEEFVLATSRGIVMKSRDGEKWSTEKIINLEFEPFINKIAAKDSIIVEVGSDGRIFRSLSENSWDLVFDNSRYKIYDLAANQDVFTALAYDRNGRIFAISSDVFGTEWTPIELTQVIKNRFPRLSVVDNSFYVAQSKIFKSTNGIKWDIDVSGRGEYFGLFAKYADSLINASSGEDVKLTKDLRDWNFIDFIEKGELFNDIRWIRDKLYILGGCNQIYASPNGEDWKRLSVELSSDDELLAIDSNSQDIIVVGVSAELDKNKQTIIVLLSKDGVNWHNVSSQVSDELARTNIFLDRKPPINTIIGPFLQE